MICPGNRCLQRLSKGLGTKRLLCAVWWVGLEYNQKLAYGTVPPVSAFFLSSQCRCSGSVLYSFSFRCEMTITFVVKAAYNK